MKLRVARHTNNLLAMEYFYCQILGLDNLGSFQKHDTYDGLFIGKRGLDWHLEFTKSEEVARHTPDEDDLLVFYLKSESELNDFRRLCAVKRIEVQVPKNPYWRRQGILIKDPDGFGVVLTIETR